MKVNISYDDEFFELAQLDIGDCFLYSGHVYMKTNSREENAIDIKTGVLRTFTPSIQVLPLDITATNSRKEQFKEVDNE